MSAPSHVVWTAAVLSSFRPGSHDWTWTDEARDLDNHVCACCGERGHYQEALEDHLRSVGGVEQPICLGGDGRVWDGHHRIVAAWRLGFDKMRAECFCDTPSECVAALYDAGRVTA